IYDIPDFPQKGIIFRDLTPLLLDPKYFNEAIRQMLEKIKRIKFDKVLSIESRGYILGSVIAHKRRVGFVPVRKRGKLLPRKTVEQEYKLEYGTDGVKIHEDAVKKGERVLIVDDLVATGGTALATAKLLEKLGGKVATFLFLNELTYLHPRRKLRNYKVISLIKF
ncbi:MAG: adenine phosphoribosyltransferase, partial [Microgenomates group bacterium LiPW_16]